MNTMKMNQQGIEATLAGVKTMFREPIVTDNENMYSQKRMNSYTQLSLEKGGEDLNYFIDTEAKYKIGEVLEIVSWDEYGYHGRWHKECEVKITNIKAEFLQDISVEDCIKEGSVCEKYHPNFGEEQWLTKLFYERDWFMKTIWNNLPYEAPNDWNSNPYVFAYEYEVER